MMTMKETTFLTMIFMFLFSCGTISNDNNKSQDNLGESFTEFFERFKRDSLFQIERVKFPWTIPSENGNKLVIYKADWQHANFFYRHDFETRKMNGYTQEIVTYGDTIKIEQRGGGNGIHVDFVFAKFDNKWFLYYEKDISN